MQRKLIRWTVLAVGAALLAAPHAQAVTIERSDGRPIARYQAWIDQARVPTAPGVVRVVFGQDATHYVPSSRTIYVRRGMRLRPGDLFHELGHDFERIALTPAGWDDWAAQVAFGMPRDARVATPFGERWAVEHFADWYAGCASRGQTLRRDGRHVVGPYGGRMLRSVVRASCSRIFRLKQNP